MMNSIYSKYTGAFIIPIYITDSIYLDFFKQTINSIKNQTCDDWITIIINDCSNYIKLDDYLKCLKENDNRFVIINVDSRESTGECRNRGIDYAYKNKCNYVMFLDADDVISSNRVEKTKCVFLKHNNYAVLYSRFVPINEFNELIDINSLSKSLQSVYSNASNKNQLDYDYMTTKLGYTNITSSTSVRIEMAHKLRFPNYYISEDYYTWMRYGAYTPFYRLDDVIVFYRIPSFTIRQSSEKYTKNFKKEKILNDFRGFQKSVIEYKFNNNKNIIEILLLLYKFLRKEIKEFLCI